MFIAYPNLNFVGRWYMLQYNLALIVAYTIYKLRSKHYLLYIFF